MGLSLIELLILAVFFLPFLFLIALLIRRHLISRHSGINIGAIRFANTGRWQSGLLALSARTLDWYPLVGFTTTPAHRWLRPTVELTEVEVAPAAPPWLLSSQPDLRLVRCAGMPIDGDDTTFEVIIPTESYKALRSWAESSPPLDRRAEY
ncbi:DUF2550 family protein [Dermatophilus congolensis]|uniref:Protein of uncharacterized function (DUF2550) n=1 Tax=Dermatophilus congolensis TaxID=1863 RepID=A0A239VF32_9MICO|nr:DUF2550 family protein [Dermatophilus congolensis]MBO3128733.1 DUF2550 family protein [Dermatophilus congolensis]MBO3132630.1 DUF2550 family protein [Dermatophilus congolensis]MBO3133209.1 DUF2550 family protein [Dermatophilus congolensis]MBO3135444.1 DUF2550 family protein [Dermatophilus congolensis]MBO3137684.1 DUF2550 family protein [Dermatophilus congolensis]